MPRSFSLNRPCMGLRTTSVVSAALSMLIACLAFPACAAAATKVQFELKDGATVSDIVTVVVKVTGADDVGIDRVEFLVDDQLKATDSSVPYSFDWDTLADTEGKHTITATAFDAQG